MVDVPGELVAYLARLLAAERRALGTRALSCVKQALLVLVWFRKNENIELLAAGFEVSQATGYRYIAEGRRVLAAQAPDLHDALRQAAEQGWAYVVLDGSLIGTDRCTQTTTSVKGDQIDAWYSGKHRQPGGNIQAFLRPDGLPIWIFDVLPGHLHDITCAEAHQMLAAACWAASQLHLPTLADSGEGAGIGIHTPIKQPTDGRRQPRLQHFAPCRTRPGRARIRPAQRLLAGPATRHRKPHRHRRDHSRRARTHHIPIRTTTETLLRSPQCPPAFPAGWPPHCAPTPSGAGQA